MLNSHHSTLPTPSTTTTSAPARESTLDVPLSPPQPKRQHSGSGDSNCTQLTRKGSGSSPALQHSDPWPPHSCLPTQAHVRGCQPVSVHDTASSHNAQVPTRMASRTRGCRVPSLPCKTPGVEWCHLQCRDRVERGMGTQSSFPLRLGFQECQPVPLRLHAEATPHTKLGVWICRSHCGVTGFGLSQLGLLPDEASGSNSSTRAALSLASSEGWEAAACSATL